MLVRISRCCTRIRALRSQTRRCRLGSGVGAPGVGPLGTERWIGRRRDSGAIQNRVVIAMIGTVVDVNVDVVEAPADVTTEILDGETQFTIAMRRILDQGCPVDPKSAVAPFNSAF